ncbi:FAD-dependent monooxygenase [Nocardia sp. NPDC003482]
MTENFDVVVAGAGPVGLMLACELRLAGARVLVVERLAEPDPTLKAGAINVPTAQAFYRRGLLPRLEHFHRTAVERIAAAVRAVPAPLVRGNKGPAGHFAGIFLDMTLFPDDEEEFDTAGPIGEAWFVNQQGIETILGEWAEELGVPVRRGVELTGFTDDSDCVTIWLGDTVIRAGWLVGCDGGRSTVRKLAGFEFPGWIRSSPGIRPSSR